MTEHHEEIPAYLINLINNILDDERRALGLRFDKDLAPEIGTTKKSISEWRRGKGITRFARTFIPLLIKHRCPHATNDTM